MIIIGIVGLLLRKDEYLKLFETYKDSADVEIHIHGKGEFQYLVEEYSKRYTNIKYFGPFNAFNDTQRIYNSLDIIYLVYDTDKVSLNNRLALPNKLYECMYYRVPLICSTKTYLGELVEEYKVGHAINYKQDGAISKAVNDIQRQRKQLKKNFEKLPENAFLGDDDYVLLDKFLFS